MKNSKKFLAILAILICSIGLLGCEKEDTRTKGEKVSDGIGDIVDGLFGD